MGQTRRRSLGLAVVTAALGAFALTALFALPGRSDAREVTGEVGANVACLEGDPADITVSVTPSPSPVKIGTTLSIEYRVSNVGCENANDVGLSAALPGPSVRTGGTSEGTAPACTLAFGVGGTCTTSFGTLVPGQSKTATFTVRPYRATTVTATGTTDTTSSQCDDQFPTPVCRNANDSASVGIDVDPEVTHADDVNDGECTVTSPLADSHCSLREAINATNSMTAAALNTIHFSIPGTGSARTIQPSIPLPTITAPVVVDGTTQPGYATGTRVELDGTNAQPPTGGSPVNVHGLALATSDSTIRGLVINRFTGNGIHVSGDRNHVDGNYIGTDVTGTLDRGNVNRGIQIATGTGNTIGGATADKRNVISGNTYGILLEPQPSTAAPATGTVIWGNYIGTDVTGSSAIPNGTGVALYAASGTSVGGTQSGQGNVISGNSAHAVYLQAASSNTIAGNLIGTKANGIEALGNHIGVEIRNGNNNLVGRTQPGIANTISGNTAEGVIIDSFPSGATGNVIAGNWIGLTATGNPQGPLGNGSHGVVIARDAVGNVIGGDDPGVSIPPGNVIANNGGAGVLIWGEGSSRQNLVRRNFIRDNAGLGIDLARYDGAVGIVTGVTPNDAGDADTGANQFQNFPVLTTATTTGAQLTVGYSFNSTPNSNFTFEFYVNSNCDPSGNGEGGNPIGNFLVVTTDASGNASGTTMINKAIGVGSFLTATATDSSNNTSEFSACRQVAQAVTVTTTLSGAGQSSPSITVPAGTAVTDQAALSGVTSTAGGTVTYRVYSDASCATVFRDAGVKTVTNGVVPASDTILFNRSGTFTWRADYSGDANNLAASSACGAEVLTLTPQALTLVVNTAVDGSDGTCTTDHCALREAIEDSNANAGRDLITFNIPGTGPRQIRLNAALPPISDPAVIDGATQPGYTGAQPFIEIDGTLVPAGVGLAVTGGNTEIRTLAIGRFPHAGIHLLQNGGNVVVGSWIGVDPGNMAAPNLEGIVIESSDNTIGGQTAAERNVISGNTKNGVLVLQSGSANQILGNRIGTNAAGTAALANGAAGVHLASAGNKVGSVDAAARNVISGNGGHGIFVADAAENNVILGNFIGTDSAGTAALGNGGAGVHAQRRTTIGGSAPGSRNVISGNAGPGVEIQGAFGSNLVQGNHIGTTADGTAALGNGLAGVFIGSSPANQVRDNVISSNLKGVRISGSGANGNTVSANRIGTSASGTASLGNLEQGIVLDGGATGNLVGGTAAGSGNLISGNGFGDASKPGAGIGVTGTLQGPPTNANEIKGNLIGTDATGTQRLPNAGPGIAVVDGASNTLIGGAFIGTPLLETSRNVIAGGAGIGVVIRNAHATLQWNYIGVARDGTPLGNALHGVLVENSSVVRIGDLGTPNVISNNGGAGVRIFGGDSNEVRGNRIGTNADGTAAMGNALSGVFIESSHGNKVLANVISGNTLNGVTIFAGATGNVVQANRIGTDASGTAALGNAGYGVEIKDASGNAIEGTPSRAGNLIAFNTKGVVVVETPGQSAVGNAIFRNTIHSNTSLGIDLGNDGVTPNDPGDADAGPNRLQNFPVLKFAFNDATSTTVGGSQDGEPFHSYRIDLFTNAACDPSGNGEGEAVLGTISVMTDATGKVDWTTTLPVVVPFGRFVTATASDSFGGTSVNTSEFSKCVKVLHGTTTTAQNAVATFGDQGVQLVATVSSSGGTPTGTVNFVVLQADGSAFFGSAFSAPLDATGTARVDFPATFPFGDVHAGTYTIVASYVGDASFVPSEDSTKKLTVNKKPTTTDTQNASAFVGQTIQLTATVVGSPVSEGTVTFTINSNAPACGPPSECPDVPIVRFGTFVANVVEGQATVAAQLTSPPLTQPIPAGTYTIKAEYQGSDHATSADTATLTLRSGTVGTASCGGTVRPNAVVRFYSGTALVLTVTAGADGTFVAELSPGTYTFTFETDGVLCGGGGITITENGGSPVVANQIVDLLNHSWRNAYTLSPQPGFTPFCLNAKVATATEHKYKAEQSLWFRVLAGRGSVVQLTVKSKGTPVDVAFYRDIAKLASAPPPSTPSQLLLVGAEAADGDFADGDFADGDFADGDFADGDFADGDFADGDFADGDFADGDFADGDFADGDFADGDFADGDFAPDQLSSGEQQFGDENTNLLQRARIGVSARPGTSDERLTKIFWGDDEYIYVKVFGDGVSLTDQVQVSVVVCPGACEGTSEPTGTPGGWTVLHGSPTAQNKTIVITDLAEQLQVADLGTALANADVQRFLAAVKAFLDLPENAPSIHVDVGTASRVSFAKAQAKQRFACSWAANLWMREVKKAIDAHRNPSLMFAVLVGDGGIIPFEEVLDRSGLASASRYLPRPPYSGSTIDRGALQNNMYLSQDRYGSKVDVNIGSFSVPVVDLAIGRVLGERARFAGDTDGLNVARGLFEAYPAATGGLVPTQGRTAGVVSYGRQDDGAEAVAGILRQSVGASNVETLRHPGGPNERFNLVTNKACAATDTDPNCLAPWDVDEFRSFIGTPRWLNVVGVHGRDSSALMADYRSRFYASEIAASATDFANTLNLWLACNVGRSVGNAYVIEGLTVGPDFPEAYARQRAVLIAPTSYTYFETELASEYQERFNIELAKQLTRGLTSWGKAFVAAKREYLIKTFQMSGIHEKQALELVYYGLPHLRSNVPAQAASSPASIVAPGDLTSSGSLQTSPEHVTFTLGEQAPVTFRDAETGAVLTPDARYWAGRDGFVTDRTMPVLPLQLENVSHPQGVPLRGVALRSGTFANETGIRLKTSAALFELMTAHSTFQSDVLYPILPWRLNFFDALARPEGNTFALFTPLQYVTESGDRQTGRVHRFASMDVNFYYNGDLSGALVSAPAIVSVAATETNVAGTVQFAVHINSAAGIHQAWITWFDVNGTSIEAIDLVCDAGGLCSGSKAFGSSAALANIRYGVWAVNVHGAVGRDLNNGSYYVPNAPEPTATEPKVSTVTSIVSITPGIGTYRGEVTMVGKLTTAGGAPVEGARLAFAIGPARGSAVTGADGTATSKLKLLMPGGGPAPIPSARYFASVSFDETGTQIGSVAETTFEVNKLATQLTVETGNACGGGYAALLKDARGEALDQEAVVFEVVGTSGQYRTVELTRHDGRAFLSHIPLPPGTYTVRAYFAGNIPIGGGQILVVNDPRYVSSVSADVSLTLPPPSLAIAYTGGTVAALGSALTFSVALQTPVDQLLLRDAVVRYTVRHEGTVVRVRDAAKGTGNDWAAIVSDLAVGVYIVRAQMLGECTQSAETEEVFVAVYDPTAGFVTGGGWIDPPAGAYAPDLSLTGRASFGFVSRYLPGATEPSGSTEFQFKAAKLNFKSTSYEWLVVAGAKAQFKGSGTINGTGSYDFKLTAIDGQVSGGGGVDKFRIRIWDRESGGLVYDNQVGASDDADPTTALAGGSIVVHKK